MSYSESAKYQPPSKNIYESLSNFTKNKGVSTNSWCLYDSTLDKYYGFRQDHRR